MESKDLSTLWVERETKREYIMDMGIGRGRGRGKRGLVALQLLLLMKRKSSEPRFDNRGVIDSRGVQRGCKSFHWYTGLSVCVGGFPWIIILSLVFLIL